MKALIGYSRCRLTQAAIEARGIEAWTCDILPADHDRHIQADIRDVATRPGWAFGIFHPMCTYLTSAAEWAYQDPDYDRWPGVGYHQKVGPDVLLGEARRQARVQAVAEFKWVMGLPYPKVAENPARGALSRLFRGPDQVIHPHQFGDDASKATGLWLDGFSPLVPTKSVPPRVIRYRGKLVRRWANQAPCGAPSAPKSAGRWLDRSRTYPGIAAAFGQFADQFLAGRHDLFTRAAE